MKQGKRLDEGNSIVKKFAYCMAILLVIAPITMDFFGNLVPIKFVSLILQWIILISSIYAIYKIIRGNDRTKSLPKQNQSGINQSRGIVMGKSGTNVIVKPETEDGHVVIVGGQGTGKSSSVSIPTLLSWKGSAVVIDIKGDLTSTTSAYREQHFGNKVFVFNPNSEECDCYDPLEQVKGIDGATELARNIIPTPLKGDKFWSNNAQAVLAASVLDGKEKNQAFCEICERILVTEPEQLINELLSSNNSQVKLLASACNSMPDKTLGGVFAELRVHLLIFASDEKIRRATRKTNWAPEVLEDGATVFLKIDEKMIEHYKGLISCMISQILRYLTGRGEGKQPSILLLLDELPRLGKVDGFIEALGTLRSRNVHIVPMVQSLSDLDRHYGQEERKICLDNCNFRVVLGVGDVDTQKYFSDMAGTEKRWQKSFNNSWIGLRKGSTDSLSEEKIIKPERFGQLKQDKKAVIFGFKEPLEVDKLFWYKTARYKNIVETYRI